MLQSVRALPGLPAVASHHGDAVTLVTVPEPERRFNTGRLVPSQLANSLGLHKGSETMASTGQSQICIFWQEFSHWTFYIYLFIYFIFFLLYLEGQSPLLMSNIQVNFGDILPETSKSSAFGIWAWIPT